MFIGLSGRGKTTLLKSLRYIGKVKSNPITIRERLDTQSLGESSGMCMYMHTVWAIIK